jgi:hypothetical protein
VRLARREEMTGEKRHPVGLRLIGATGVSCLFCRRTVLSAADVLVRAGRHLRFLPLVGPLVPDDPPVLCPKCRAAIRAEDNL